MGIMIPSESTRFNRRIDCALNIVQYVWGILRWHTTFYSPFWIVIVSILLLNLFSCDSFCDIRKKNDWRLWSWMTVANSRFIILCQNEYLPTFFTIREIVRWRKRISTKGRTHKLETHSTMVRYQIAASWPAFYNACYLVMLLV
jgi:hypothetical protein